VSVYAFLLLSQRPANGETEGARHGWCGRWEVVKMALGTVKWFNDAKGYGFISRADDGKDVFVHYSSITGEGFRTLNQGQTVEYEESQGPKGLFAAKVLKAM
jgi:CspA family cold shock protein